MPRCGAWLLSQINFTQVVVSLKITCATLWISTHSNVFFLREKLQRAMVTAKGWVESGCLFEGERGSVVVRDLGEISFSPFCRVSRPAGNEATVRLTRY